MDLFTNAFVFNQAGWMPPELDTISDVFSLVKPKEVYEILSALWKYFKVTDFLVVPDIVSILFRWDLKFEYTPLL